MESTESILTDVVSTSSNKKDLYERSCEPRLRPDNVALGRGSKDLDDLSKVLNGDSELAVPGSEHDYGDDVERSCPCNPTGGAAARRSTIADASKSTNAEFESLEGLQMTTGECAEDASRPGGSPCSSGAVIQAIEKFAETYAGDAPAPGEKKPTLLPIGNTEGAAAVRAAAAALHCDSESCVLSHPDFVKFANQSEGISSRQIALEKEQKFKTAGPRNSTELLNNFHIDETLQRWARVFTEFFPYPFAMMDFDKTGEPFARWDIVDILEGKVAQEMGPGYKPVRRKTQCAGCVLNTDTHDGPGKHWVAAFVDTRKRGSPNEDWTIEYFNSAGRPPPRAMVGWMEKTRARLENYRKQRGDTGKVLTVPVTAIAHQDSQTECGLFSLFFLRKRLEGTPYTFFQNSRKLISDDAMTKFRQFVFRANT